jgi:hypothetical protein
MAATATTARRRKRTGDDASGIRGGSLVRIKADATYLPHQVPFAARHWVGVAEHWLEPHGWRVVFPLHGVECLIPEHMIEPAE